MLSILGWSAAAKHDKLMHHKSHLASANINGKAKDFGAQTTFGISRQRQDIASVDRKKGQSKPLENDTSSLSAVQRFFPSHLVRTEALSDHEKEDKPDKVTRCLESDNIESSCQNVHSSSPHQDPGSARGKQANAREQALASPIGKSQSRKEGATIIRNKRRQSSSSSPETSVTTVKKRKRSLCPNDRPDTVLQMESLQQALFAQYNLEVLLKHRELRLIDQEIAKCQAALEQLRRCTETPYLDLTKSCHSPNYDGYNSTRSDTSGMPAILCQQGITNTTHGDTNKAYSQHYRHWLLPQADLPHSATFSDRAWPSSTSLKTDSPNGPCGPAPEHELRNSRTSNVSNNTYASCVASLEPAPAAEATKPRSRAVRASVSATYPLWDEYQESRSGKGPMIVKRASDGHLVKLVCLDCTRSDFNSVQGFINHCRIQHSRTFINHSAAVESSGEEIHAVPSKDMAVQEAVAANTRNASSRVSPATKDSDSQHGAASIVPKTGLIHPYIQQDSLLSSESGDGRSFEAARLSLPVLSSNASKCNDYTKTKAKILKKIDGSNAKDDGQAPSDSTSLLQLHKLLDKTNSDQNYRQLIRDAQEKPDVPTDDEVCRDDDAESSSDSNYEEAIDEPAEVSIPQSTRGIVKYGTRSHRTQAQSSPAPSNSDEIVRTRRSRRKRRGTVNCDSHNTSYEPDIVHLSAGDGRDQADFARRKISRNRRISRRDDINDDKDSKDHDSAKEPEKQLDGDNHFEPEDSNASEEDSDYQATASGTTHNVSSDHDELDLVDFDGSSASGATTTSRSIELEIEDHQSGHDRIKKVHNEEELEKDSDIVEGVVTRAARMRSELCDRNAAKKETPAPEDKSDSGSKRKSKGQHPSKKRRNRRGRRF